MRVYKIGRYEYSKGTSFGIKQWCYRDPMTNGGQNINHAGDQVSALLDAIERMTSNASFIMAGSGVTVTGPDDEG